MYRIVYTKKTVKDVEKIKTNKLDTKTKRLIEVIKNNPFQTPPPFERLLGNLERCVFKTY